MRDIKFRGKNSNGEWVYGSLINDAFFVSDTMKSLCYILDSSKMEYDCWEDIANVMDEFKVIPETVGQYTGLKDKNGVEIYEGDKINDIFGDVKGIVKFGEYRNPHGDDGFGGHIGFYVEWNDRITRKDLKYWSTNSEIIGNIHDNMEPPEGVDWQ